jgi:GDPmannose 4,6-dehydratase
MKKAFITGINGQDGSYLAEYLLELGYEVHGIIRRNSSVESQQSRFSEEVRNKVNIHYGDLLDQGGLEKLLDEIQPDEIYNLAAQSHVRISFDIPQFTVQTNAIGILNILEAYRRACPTARFYQASSSEMFGNSVDADGFQRESTQMTPVSPYGCSKVFGYNITRNYRNAYKLHTCNGILFNHESPRRGETFVTRKITRAVARIAQGSKEKLFLGNLDAVRDWGYAKEYVESMWLMLQQDKSDDYVVATGVGATVRDFAEASFKHVGLNWEDHVELDKRYIRPTEVDALIGDPSKAEKALGWKAKTHWKALAELMVEADLEKAKTKSN